VITDTTASAEIQEDLTPDLDQSRRMLEIIGPGSDAQFGFRACADRCTDIRETRKCFGTLDHGIRQSNSEKTNGRPCRPAGILEQRQRSVGTGAYVIPNMLDGKGQRLENVIGIRALFVDADTKEQVRSALRFSKLIPPGLINASGGIDGGIPKVQVFWPVEGCPADEFTKAQLLLISRAGGDPAVKDACRLMRLAGLYHLKREPRMTRIVWADRRIRYDYRDLIRRIRSLPQICDPLAPVARATTTTTIVGRRRPAAYSATGRLNELIAEHDGLVKPAVRKLIEEIGAAGCDRHNSIVAACGRLIQLRWPEKQALEFLAPLVNQHFQDGDWTGEVERATEHARRRENERLGKIKSIVWEHNANV
jgi:hypothetical protein